jgi:hypothetical protein
MGALSATELVGVWERGAAQTLPQRALELLAAAMPDVSPGELARLTVGRRDILLLTLRQEIFGPQLASLVTCPGCDQCVELNFDSRQIIRQEKCVDSAGEFSIVIRNIQLRLRLPTAGDLAALPSELDIQSARRNLLESCVVEAHRGGKQLSLPEILADLPMEIEEHLALADPDAHMQFVIDCPACTLKWRAVFDIVSFFWTEIGVWGGRLLRDIHSLACAYGWSERDILGMHPLRRQSYLELIGA